MAGTDELYLRGSATVSVDDAVLAVLKELSSTATAGVASHTRRAAQDAHAVATILKRGETTTGGAPPSVRIPGGLVRVLERKVPHELMVSWEELPDEGSGAAAPAPAAVDAFRRAQEQELLQLSRRGVVRVGSGSGAASFAMPAPRGPIAVALVILSSGIAVAAILSLAARIGGEAGRSPVVALGVAAVFVAVDAVLITRMLWSADRESAGVRARAEGERARKREERRGLAAAAAASSSPAGATTNADDPPAGEVGRGDGGSDGGGRGHSAVAPAAGGSRGRVPSGSPPRPVPSPLLEELARESAEAAVRRRRAAAPAGSGAAADEVWDEEVDATRRERLAHRSGVSRKPLPGLAQSLAEALAREAAEAAAARGLSPRNETQASGPSGAAPVEPDGAKPAAAASEAVSDDGSGREAVTEGGWQLVG